MDHPRRHHQYSCCKWIFFSNHHDRIRNESRSFPWSNNSGGISSMQDIIQRRQIHSVFKHGEAAARPPPEELSGNTLGRDRADIRGSRREKFTRMAHSLPRSLAVFGPPGLHWPTARRSPVSTTMRPRSPAKPDRRQSQPALFLPCSNQRPGSHNHHTCRCIAEENT